MARASGLPTTAALTRAAKTLARTDKVMARLVDDHGPPRIEFQTHSAFVSLARAIVFQQLAGSAARAIFGRVQEAVGVPFNASAVRGLDDATLRACGLSSAKLAALKDLATKVDDGDVRLAGLSRLSDEDVIASLVQVRGIGRWTAEMFLLFKLGRLDVWPVTDYGVQKGFMLAYGLRDLPKPRVLDEKGQAYAGVRSLAAWYFWRRAEAG